MSSITSRNISREMVGSSSASMSEPSTQEAKDPSTKKKKKKKKSKVSRNTTKDDKDTTAAIDVEDSSQTQSRKPKKKKKPKKQSPPTEMRSVHENENKDKNKNEIVKNALPERKKKKKKPLVDDDDNNKNNNEIGPYDDEAVPTMNENNHARWDYNLTDEDRGTTVPTATLVIPVATPIEIPMNEQDKQGEKCCGCCCDYRRAVIIFGIVGILWVGFSIIMIFTIPTLITVDDDALATSLEETLVLGWWDVVAFVTLLLGFIMQFYAALGYNVSVLCCVVVILLFNCVWNISFTIVIGGYWFNIIQTIIQYAIYIYPVVGLISEIKSGIMSKETYPREAYSCCCLTNPR